MRNLYPLIKELIVSGAKTPDDLSSLKKRFAKKYRIPCPSNMALLKTYHKLTKTKSIKPSVSIEILLRTRPVRSLSGIVNVSVLTKPYRCPGQCLFCPIEKGIPKSYVSGEPAVERAKRLNYDPYIQVKRRIETLTQEGHPTDKIELRIIGGTWSFYPKKYQTWFIKRCFEACNIGGRASLNTAQKRNEKAKHRIVGLSVETRPDFITPLEIKRLRELGVTMVELGVQATDDDILKKNLRGHGVKETVMATQLLKDAGFKVLYQMMPNLYGSSLNRDLKMFKTIFSDSRFQPDLLKIYPCALLRQSPLFNIWRKGGYSPYSQKQLIDLIKAIKKIVPYYVRIQRIVRDIPSRSIVEGPAKISNLRQMVKGNCKCIRCREVKKSYDPKEKIKLFRQDYGASGGKEIFLSYENKTRTKLFSLLRLRIANNQSVIRELHTYGQLQPINGSSTAINSPQHKGLGRRLVKEAEGISKKESASGRIVVISGVGVRGYYRKLGYKLEKTYMVKNLG
ncbi:MAG: tRNA uridine(34) 5-carboxymethylaminomethyl modification radical SAM/GNAT enzyme Elp3 [Candidatus Nealsonbacteria bacterium]